MEDESPCHRWADQECRIHPHRAQADGSALPRRNGLPTRRATLLRHICRLLRIGMGQTMRTAKHATAVPVSEKMLQMMDDQALGGGPFLQIVGGE